MEHYNKIGSRFRGNDGFSLVELLVVISIIAVISAVTLPNFMGARERARDAQRVSDMNAIKNSLRMYYNDKQAYPTPAGGMFDSGMTTYMPSILNLGYTYTYEQSNAGDGFNLCLRLESGVGDDDVNSQKKCGVGVGLVCGLGQTTDKLFVVCAN